MGRVTLPADKRPEEITGFEALPEGRYHTIVTDVQAGKETKNGKRYDQLTLQVLAGEKSGQENKKIWQSLFYKEENGLWVEGDAHVRYAWAAGLLKPGQTLDLRPEDFGGTQFIIQVMETEYNGKKTTQIGNFGFDVWPVGHPDVANVPLGKFQSAGVGNDVFNI